MELKMAVPSPTTCC